jgi:PPM family protein phosphatase
MTSFETCHHIETYRERCEDRIEVITDGDRTLIVVADGAGGTGAGHLAAEIVIRETRAHYAAIDNSTDWSQFLSQLDFRVHTGEGAQKESPEVVGCPCRWPTPGPAP